MKGHLYRYRIEHLEDPKGNPVDAKPLTFETKNHDDLFKIVQAMKQKGIVDEAESIELVIGLKLFGEVMLRNRDSDFFKEIKPHFANIMQAIKSY